MAETTAPSDGTNERKAMLASVGAAAPAAGTHFVITRRGKIQVPVERAPSGPIPWAAGLVTALEETGTGTSILEVIDRAMLERYTAPEHAGKGPRDADRHLTSAEAIAAMERANLDPYTIKKARALAATGAYRRPAPKFQIDALPPPPDGAPPPRAGATPEVQAPVPPVEEIAGVQDLASGTPTIGLLPLPPDPAAPVQAPAPESRGVRATPQPRQAQAPATPPRRAAASPPAPVPPVVPPPAPAPAAPMPPPEG